MANIRLSRIEAEECQLPLVCARCGAAASTVAYKDFSWHPDWIYLFLVLGCLVIGLFFPLFLLGIVVYIVFNWKLSKRMQVRLPFCRDHANHWQLRSLLTGASLALIVPIELTLFVLLFDYHHDWVVWFSSACCGVPLAWLILAFVLDLTSIRCQEITDQAIQLSGVHEDFVAAVAAEHQRHLALLSTQAADSLSDSSIRSAEPPRRPPPAGEDKFFAPRKD